MKIFFVITILSLITISCNRTAKNNAEEESIPYTKAKNAYKKELLEWNKKLVEVDNDVISKFIERRRWKMDVTETGLYWQIYKKTDGKKAQGGDIAEFSYTTSLLNGEVLYSSEKSGNRTLNLDHNQEESGLNEGIKMMKVGEKARFILPPHLAFGITGDGYKVPIYSILVFDVELLSLTQPEIEEIEENEI